MSPTQNRPTTAGASPLTRLLRYVRGHRVYAMLTLGFGVMGFALSFAYPWIVGSAVDVVARTHPGLSLAEREGRLVWLTELAAGAALGHAAVVYGRGHFNVHLGDGIVADIRRDLFEHLQRLSVGFYTKERTGSVAARVLYEVNEATSLIYTGVIVAGMDAVQLVVAIALLAAISWKLTLACMAVFPLYGVVFFVMNPRVRAASERMHAQLSLMSGNVAEQLSGQALVKTCTAEAREAKRFAEDLTRYHDLVIDQSHQGHLVASAGEVLVNMGTTIVVGYGGWLALRGEMTAGMVTRFLGYVLVMYGPVRRFAELNIIYQSSLSAMRRVFRVLEIRPGVVEPSRPHVEAPSLGGVRFESVRFRYGDETADLERMGEDLHGLRAPSPPGAWVLDGVTIDARPGEHLAVVGASGVGKTTLVSLLPRLYDVTEGRVLVDGIDVRDYSLLALRSAIAVVAQDSFVFSGTIRDNIRYGRPQASDADVVEAAHAAFAHEFISRLPGGYDARLGERGVNLSGGQRQRISIARALLRNPRILILDEATSALDAESESVVQRALERVMCSRTCFVIAHRLSTIRNADRIFVLEGGTVAESGTHGELLARSDAYARLVRHQRGAA
jgi:ABC-type multidrug transport system fused ATPase/permease subunit